jgi:hypothetical protein
MLKQLDAVYENGVLRPLTPLTLSEQQQVRLTLDDQPIPEPSVTVSGHDPFRREEMFWLAHNSAPYAGQWVALSGSRLIAHGPEPAAVWETARLAGVDRPLVTHLPQENELPFGGW